MIQKTALSLICLSLGALSACTAVGERTLVSVGYYTVSGDTFGELDREIKIHGPNVNGVGKALASTDLRMFPDIRYVSERKSCSISTVRINVKARVTLPRHKNEKTLKRDLARAWNNLEEYARVHEAVHLAVADRYALLIEKQIKALKAAPTCTELRANVSETFSSLSRKHHDEQLQFDADEKVRIRKLAGQVQPN